MNESVTENENQDTAIRTLAIVGFIALVCLGMWLAIYSSRFVPTAVNTLNAAAVSLSSIFHSTGNDNNSLSVSTTSPFDKTTPTTTEPTPVTTAKSSATKKTSKPSGGTYAIGTTTVPVALHGLPDLTTSILAVGYLTSTSTDSFIASTTVPTGMRPAVKFLIKNIGTNIVPEGWKFNASLPATTAYIFVSDPQQQLNPGDSIEYTLGFDQGNVGVDQPISIFANPDNSVIESDQSNNGASAKITIQ